MAYRNRNYGRMAKWYKQAQRGPKAKMSTFSRMRKDINRMKRTLNQVELKFFDANVDDAAVSNAGTVQGQVFTVPQDDTQSGRHGRKINLTSFHIRGIIGLASTATIASGSDTCRIMVIWDKQANGALPAVGDVLAATNWESFPNLEERRRFKILADRFVSMPCQGAAGNGTANDTCPTEKYFSIYKKVNIPIEYNDSAATGVISTISSNNIVVLYISRLGFVSIEACCRTRYTDI